MLKTFTLALAAAALIASPAVSAQERDVRTSGIIYNDLDLSTDHGRIELDRRIDLAAKNVCGINEHATGSNIASRESRECYRDAKRQINQRFAAIMEDQARGG